MRILITGVAGFIGSRLAEEGLKRGHEIVGVDSFNRYYDPAIKRRRVERILRPGFELVDSALESLDLEETFRRVDAIFHEAGQPGVRQSWSAGFEDYCSGNILLTQRVLEALVLASANGGRGPKLVFASSSSVYGNQEGMMSETCLPQPMSPYGVSKLAAEHLCGTYARTFDVDVVSLRYFTVYGGGQRPDMAIQRLIISAIRGEKFTLYGSGEQTRDFTHVDDVVRANFLALEKQVAKGSVFNICGGSPVSLNTVIERLREILGAKLEVSRMATQPGDVMATRGDASYAARELDWEPRWTLGEGLREQVAYQLSA